MAARIARWGLALGLCAVWWWAVLRLALTPHAGALEGAVAAGGWGLSLLPVHCMPKARAVGAVAAGRWRAAWRGAVVPVAGAVPDVGFVGGGVTGDGVSPDSGVTGDGVWSGSEVTGAGVWSDPEVTGAGATDVGGMPGPGVTDAGAWAGQSGADAEGMPGPGVTDAGA